MLSAVSPPVSNIISVQACKDQLCTNCSLSKKRAKFVSCFNMNMLVLPAIAILQVHVDLNCHLNQNTSHHRCSCSKCWPDHIIFRTYHFLSLDHQLLCTSALFSRNEDEDRVCVCLQLKSTDWPSFILAN